MPIPKRPIRIEGDIAYVPLPHGREAIIDAEDADKVGLHNWCVGGHGYVVTHLPTGNGKNRILGLHRLLMGEPNGKQVDHADRNPMDNRKKFLRIATNSQNLSNRGAQSNNTSGHKGVSWSKTSKKWRADINHEGARIYLGMFTDLESASKAYCEAALKYHGEFAHTA